ncbi:MAG: response regulator [Melioribacteraceae bacterium]|jgi:DNA-binding response OmpR family regulator|nr:response regulator [Melioribacteraceae bacterium]
MEDDMLSQDAMRTLLHKIYEIDYCDSAELFYSRFVDKKYDIILMDISLRGEKDGLQLTQEIKELPLHKGTPILCVTAHAYSRDKKNAYDAGVDFYMSKPFSKDVLINKINELTSI